jgi:hypothetical protein
MNLQSLLASRLEIDDSRLEYWLAFSIALLGVVVDFMRLDARPQSEEQRRTQSWPRRCRLRGGVASDSTALVGLLFALLVIVQCGVLLILAAPFWLIASSRPWSRH